MPPTSKPEGAGTGKPSLRTIFETEEAPLLGYALSLVQRREIAEEIVQEVFLQLHTHWDEVEKPVAWLYRSVRNRSYNHHRDHKHEVLAENERETKDERAGTPDNLLERMEAAGSLRLLMSELEETDRQLVHLKFFEDLKYREISDRTGLTIGNVGYRLHHILNQMADKLRQMGIDGTTTPER